MRKHIARARRSVMLKRVLGVASGNSVGQLIVLLFAPLITRIYSPEVFGIQGVFLAAVTLMAPVVTLRFPMAVVLAENELEMRRVERLSWMTSFVVSGTVLLIIVFFQSGLARVLRLDAAGVVIYLLPVGLLMTAFQEIALHKAARWERFRAISWASAAQSLIVNSAKVVGGLLAPISLVLVAVASLGPGIHALLLPRRAKEVAARAIPQIRLKSLWRTAVKHRDFATMRMPTDLLNAASQAAPVIVLGIFFGPVVAGWYTLAKSVLAVPSNVIGNAVGTVFYADFADRDRNGLPLTGTLLSSTLLLFAGPGALILVTCLFFPSLFGLFFGEEWRSAGQYAQWMALWIVVALANVPSVRLAPVIRRQGVLLRANLIMLGLRVGSLYFASRIFDDPLSVVAAYSIVSAFSNLGLIVRFGFLAKRYDREASLVRSVPGVVSELKEHDE